MIVFKWKFKISRFQQIHREVLEHYCVMWRFKFIGKLFFHTLILILSGAPTSIGASKSTKQACKFSPQKRSHCWCGRGSIWAVWYIDKVRSLWHTDPLPQAGGRAQLLWACEKSGGEWQRHVNLKPSPAWDVWPCQGEHTISMILPT